MLEFIFEEIPPATFREYLNCGLTPLPKGNWVVDFSPVEHDQSIHRTFSFTEIWKGLEQSFMGRCRSCIIHLLLLEMGHLGQLIRSES